MAEYIEREALLTEIAELHMKHKLADNEEMIFSESDIRGLVLCLPAAEVEPVRHGEWTKSEDDWNSLTTITCSECHEEWCFETEEDVSLLNYRYCPHCGARMDGGADDAN